jgi:hypothetical protein
MKAEENKSTGSDDSNRQSYSIDDNGVLHNCGPEPNGGFEKVGGVKPSGAVWVAGEKNGAVSVASIKPTSELLGKRP